MNTMRSMGRGFGCLLSPRMIDREGGTACPARRARDRSGVVAAIAVLAIGTQVASGFGSVAHADDGCVPSASAGKVGGTAGLSSGTAEGPNCAARFIPRPPQDPVADTGPWVLPVPRYPDEPSAYANVSAHPEGARLSADSAAGLTESGKPRLDLGILYEKLSCEEISSLISVSSDLWYYVGQEPVYWAGKAAVGFDADIHSEGWFEVCEPTVASVDFSLAAAGVCELGAGMEFGSTLRWDVVDENGIPVATEPPAGGSIVLAEEGSITGSWKGVVPAGRWKLVARLDAGDQAVFRRAFPCSDEIVWSARDEAHVSIVLGERPAADLDGSGCVDQGDIAMILLSFGEAAVPADLDGSGLVDMGDVAFALLSFGECL